MDEYVEAYHAQERLIADLRAALAPVLDDPYVEKGPHNESWQECRYCEVMSWENHTPDCPASPARKAYLLGLPEPADAPTTAKEC